APFEVNADHFAQPEIDVAVPAQDRTHRVDDRFGFEAGGRHLIQQRQEGMVIVPVDERDRDALAAERLRRAQTPQPPPHHHPPPPITTRGRRICANEPATGWTSAAVGAVRKPPESMTWSR